MECSEILEEGLVTIVRYVSMVLNGTNDFLETRKGLKIKNVPVSLRLKEFRKGSQNQLSCAERLTSKPLGDHRHGENNKKGEYDKF